MKTVLLMAVVLAFTSTVHAATVSVLKPEVSSPALTEALFRLQGELLAVGLEVEVDNRPPGFDADTAERTAWFERMASERGIDAIIDLLGSPTPAGVDVWIFQTGSGRFQASRVMLDPSAPSRPETLAIRAIEVLRANFLVIDPPEQRPKQRPPPEPREEPTHDQPTDETEPVTRFGAAAGASLLTSFDGVGPALLPVVRLDWAFYAGLAAEMTLSGFGTRPTVETEAGSVTVAQDFGLLGLRYVIPSDSSIAAIFALDAGALRTTLDGAADSPHHGHRVQQWSFLTQGTLGAKFELSARYYLCLAGHVQWATPYAAIHFVDTQVATTGHPNLLASLTVGAWL